jgi:hypothetical protein
MPRYCFCVKSKFLKRVSRLPNPTWRDRRNRVVKGGDITMCSGSPSGSSAGACRASRNQGRMVGPRELLPFVARTVSKTVTSERRSTIVQMNVALTETTTWKTAPTSSRICSKIGAREATFPHRIVRQPTGATRYSIIHTSVAKPMDTPLETTTPTTNHFARGHKRPPRHHRENGGTVHPRATLRRTCA